MDCGVSLLDCKFLEVDVECVGERSLGSKALIAVVSLDTLAVSATICRLNFAKLVVSCNHGVKVYFIKFIHGHGSHLQRIIVGSR